MTKNSMLGYYPYTLFQTLPVPLAARGKKGRPQGGGGDSLHRPTSSIREEKRTLRQGHE